MIRLFSKLSWPDIKAQCRWLYNAAQGFKHSILLLTGISTISSLLSVLSAWLIKTMIDMAVGTQQSSLPGVALLFVLVLALDIATNAVLGIFSTKAKTRQANKLQAQLFQKLMAAKWQAMIQRHSGDYCSRMISDVDAINSFLLSAIPDIISTMAQLLAATWVLILLEPCLAILALTITPVFLVLTRLFSKPMRETTMHIQNLKGENLSLSQESIQNIITIRAFEQQAEVCRRLSALQNRLLFWSVRRAKLSALSSALQAISWSATYILSLMWGILRLSQKAISYGSMAAYLQLVSQIQGPFRWLAAQIPQMIAASASIGRLMEVLDIPEENLKQSGAAFTGPPKIIFENVCFAYQTGEQVLNKINMEIAPGAVTALIGPTGEGKSTIARLLLGIVEPQEGSILLHCPDGSIHPVGVFTRSAFTYVQQENTAMSGTIADNLRLAKPAATPEEMEAALKQACAWEFVSALEKKLETSIGEHGIGLSEGQQQRLAIARALLRNAPILILDEATSALDKKTEAQVLRNIQSALHGRTCLVITHRSAALRLCSRVYRLSKGKTYLSTIIDAGNIKRLQVKKSRSYFRAAPAS